MFSKHLARKSSWLSVTLTVVAAHGAPAFAQDHNDADLAQQLSNPVADLISVPFQLNYDKSFGPERAGHKLYMNIQPVVPIRLDPDWNIISRTIMPVVSQQDVLPGTDQFGIGDITQSLFFSPVKPTAGGLIWGVGPVFLLPTGTESELSGRKWGLGPTGVMLKLDGPWTYGILANHIWSVFGVSSRPDISATFLQPFVAYTTKTAWTYSLNTESTYDWKASDWSVPINATVSKLIKFGKQPVSIGGGMRYWATSPESGPHGWGIRAFVTLLFPK